MTSKELIKECQKRGLPYFSMLLEALYKEDEQLPEELVEVLLMPREPRIYNFYFCREGIEKFNKCLKECYETL